MDLDRSSIDLYDLKGPGFVPFRANLTHCGRSLRFLGGPKKYRSYWWYNHFPKTDLNCIYLHSFRVNVVLFRFNNPNQK